MAKKKYQQFSEMTRRVQRLEKDMEFLLEEVNLLKARLLKVEHRTKRLLDHIGGVSDA